VDVVSWQHAAFLKPINALLLRLRQRRSLLWIADSNNVADWAGRKLGIAPERMAVWPLFSADESAPQASSWQRGTPLRIGSLGRLHRVKGYDVLIAALAQLSAGGFSPPMPIEIDVAGDGSLRAELVTKAAAAGLHRVHFIGFTEPRSFLSGLHLYLQPSRSEGLCIAAHEAMQAGLPVLASAVGELPYSILQGQTGRLVPPGEPAALAQALAELLGDPDRLAAMGAAARERVLDRFGAAAFSRAGADVLQRIRLARSGTSAHAPDRSTSPPRNGQSASHRSA
jgi:glycosyltransferase involved in cell wall biosynthesis